MTKRKTDPSIAIPTYSLYGEETDTADDFWFHCETIQARSSLHHWEIGLHRHEHLFQLLLITDGSGDAVFGKEIVRFEPLTAITIPPSVGHGFRFSPDIDGFVFTLMASRLPARMGESSSLKRFLAAPRVVALPMQIPDVELIKTMLTRLAMEFDQRLSGRTIIMEACLATALTLIARVNETAGQNEEAEDGQDRRMEALSALIHRHIRAHKPASFYALALGISPTHLNRIVKARTGLSMHALLMHRLLDEAKRELLFTSGTVQEVGFRLGFSDPAYFSRFFARETGLTPRAWRLKEQARL